MVVGPNHVYVLNSHQQWPHKTDPSVFHNKGGRTPKVAMVTGEKGIMCLSGVATGMFLERKINNPHISNKSNFN